MGRSKRDKGVWTAVGLAVVAAGLLIGLSLASVGAGRKAAQNSDTALGAVRNVWGSDSAPVKLLEYGDYLCPHCAEAAEVLEEQLTPLIEEGKVQYTFQIRWLGWEGGLEAAEAAQCAADQDMFWSYHSALFKNQTGGFTVDKLKQLAKEVGLNTKAFNQCLDSGKYKDQVLEQTQEAADRGVNGTPMFFLNGEYVRVEESFTEVVDAVKEELGEE